MKLQLSELPNYEEKEFVWSVPDKWIEEILAKEDETNETEEPLFSAKGPLSLVVWLYRNEREVFFRAKADGFFKALCVRCLSPFDFPLNLEFSGLFRPRQLNSFDEPEDSSHYLYQEDEIDFSEALREEIFLQLPLNPNCVGGCSEELVSLSSSEQSSFEPAIDPRWEGLLKFKQAKN